MSVTYGFYDSPSATDRRLYSATQMGELFQGIISDGVFPNIGNALFVTKNSGSLSVTLGSGRAWFNDTWTNNSTDLVFNLDAAHATYGRYDLLVLEVDKTPNVAKNEFKIIKGTPALSPAKPTITNTDSKFIYPLASILIPAGATNLNSATVTSYIGTEQCPYVKAIGSAEEYSPEQHNNIYRGKYLGDTITDTQYNNIKNGTFKDMYIGDYWDAGGSTGDGINSTRWIIAGFDYYYNKGDNPIKTHHVVLVCNNYIGTPTTWINDKDTMPSSGYNGSDARLYLGQQLATVMSSKPLKGRTIFQTRDYLCNGVSTGAFAPNHGIWGTQLLELLSEVMVFGCNMYAPGTSAISNSIQGTYVESSLVKSTNNTQLPLFRLAPKHIALPSNKRYWLRNIAHSGKVCLVDPTGSPDIADATEGMNSSALVYARPFLCI